MNLSNSLVAFVVYQLRRRHFGGDLGERLHHVFLHGGDGAPAAEWADGAATRARDAVMTTHVSHTGPSVTARRAGYAVAMTVNLVLLYLVNVSPGWQAVPFLTESTTDVLLLVNLSMVAAVVANAVYSVVDSPWVRALGDAVTTSVGLASLIQIWQVFPFAFDTTSVPWDVVARWVIGVAIFGCVVAIIVALVRLVRAVVDEANR